VLSERALRIVAPDRAAEAMKAAETLFADEMGANLDLSRPQRRC